MIHFRARRLLPDLVDGTLPPAVEIDVGAHVASCARCRRIERELRWAETLLLAVPPRLLPLETSARSHDRLSGLSRWAADPEAGHPGRWRFPAVSLATAFGLALLAGSMGRWASLAPYTVYVPHEIVRVVAIPLDPEMVPSRYR